MSILTIVLRCVIGAALGAAPGIALFVYGSTQQGIGLAIIGGALGLILSLSSVLYQTTTREMFSRCLGQFARVMVEYNLPFAERFLPEQPPAILDRGEHLINSALLDARAWLGVKVGALLTLVPAILAAVYFHDENSKSPLIKDLIVRLVLAFLVLIVGGVCGAAMGVLTVPGVHRRNIVLGTVAGTTIGTGLAVAIASGARIPEWQIYLATCCVFGFLGLTCGLVTAWTSQPPAGDYAEETERNQRLEG